MSEQHLIDLMERTADRVPDSRAPIREVLDQGRARQRRTRGLIAAGAAAVVVLAVGMGIGLTRGGSTHEPVPVHPAPLPAPPAGMKWSGIGTTVFAVPESFEMRPGYYCPAFDGHDWLTVTRSDVVIACTPGGANGEPPLPPSDIVEFVVDPQGGLLRPAVSLPHDVARFDDTTLRASRMTLPDGWTAVPAGLPTNQSLSPTADSELSALHEAGFRTEVKQMPYWGVGPIITTSPEIGAPAPVGSLVTVYDGLPSPAVAELAGQLREVGGPAPGITAVSGWVHVHSDAFDEYVYTDRHGNWSVSVPGGVPYTITGAYVTMPDGTADESCRAAHNPVTPQLEQFAASSDIGVYCSVD